MNKNLYQKGRLKKYSTLYVKFGEIISNQIFERKFNQVTCKYRTWSDLF